MLIVLIGISFLTFLLTYMSPGDPVRNMYLSTGIMPSEKEIEETREAMGFNDPFLVRYGRWIGGCLQGDFGESYSLNKPVVDLLMARLWPTLQLTIASLLIMIIISVPLGILSAVYKNKPIDYIVRAVTFFGVSLPNFWVGLMLILVFCVQMRIFNVVASSGSLQDLVLPAVTLAIAMSAKYTRQVRTAVLEELSSDYVVGLRARGVPEWKILWFNVLPNSFLPLITMLGISIGSLLGGTSVVEVVFSYPGLGNLAVNAIMSSDYYLIQGYVLWVSVIYMIVNLVVDISYNYIDPRIRIRR
jgi:peptide/nickel transport system permease protein